MGKKYFLVKAAVIPLEWFGSGQAYVEQSPEGGTLNEIEIKLAGRDTELSLNADKFVTQVDRAVEALIV